MPRSGKQATLCIAFFDRIRHKYISAQSVGDYPVYLCAFLTEERRMLKHSNINCLTAQLPL